MDKNLKRNKKFKPTTQPRYLWGQVALSKLNSDLKSFNQHRSKVFYATNVIDNRPPYMNPYNYFNLRKLSEDVVRIKQIDKGNKILVCKINAINRNGGAVECWNKSECFARSLWPLMVIKHKKILAGNKILYNQICHTYSEYSKEESARWFKDKILERMIFACKYPMVIFDHKTVDQLVNEQPSISLNMPKLEKRPKAYMTFQMKDNRTLGQIVIELFIDYAPQTVEYFLALCSTETKKSYLNCIIYNSLKGKYFETGDIARNNVRGGVAITVDKFKREDSPLKHCRPGVLSMVPLSRRYNNSKFSITMRPMPEFDGKRVVFGQIIKGNDTICKINDMSRKIGSPLIPIIITKCGEVPERSESDHDRKDLKLPA